MSTQIQIRRDTEANWTSVNPVLADGEIGFDVTSNRFKVGNGVDAWNDIEFSGSSVATEEQPNDPSKGDQWFDPNTGNLLIWNGSEWITVSGGNTNIPIVDTPPEDPEIGQQWFSSTDGYLYIWYGAEWVAANMKSSSDGGGDGVDPEMVKLLINAEGFEDGNTDYDQWDISGNAQPITYSSGISVGRVSADQAKHGNRSIKNADQDSNNASGFFNLGVYEVDDKPWTFEFWSYRRNMNQTVLTQLAGKWTNSSTDGRAWQLSYDETKTQLELMHSPAGTSFSRLPVNYTIPKQQWIHVAVVYNADLKTFTCFMDGRKTIEITDCDPIDPVSRQWHLGGILNATHFYGAYFDDVRLVIGEAVYTADFIPPSEFARASRSDGENFSSRPWTDDSNDLEDSNDADLS